MVSFLIRARDEEAHLRVLLPILRGQTYPSDLVEIVVVDNESTDRTVEVAREARSVIVPISHSEWSWGRALNRGVKACRGDLIAVLSCDAHPVDRRWTEDMVRHFDDPLVAGVYGRQLPHDDAPLDEWQRVDRKFPASSREWRAPVAGAGPPADLIASNSASMMRRDVLTRIPFREDKGAEEGVWVQAVVHAGFVVRYVGHPCVYHSHREPARRSALRGFEKAIAASGRPMNWIGVMRVVLYHLRRRIGAILTPGGGLRRRLESGARLPFDLLVWLAIGLRLAGGMPLSEARRRWW